jgi:hypothetical protein
MPPRETVREKGLQTWCIFLLFSQTIMSISLMDLLNVLAQADMVLGGGKAAHGSLEEAKIRDAPPCIVAPTDAHDHCRPHGWCLGLPPASQGRGEVVSDKPWEAPFLSGRSSALASYGCPPVRSPTRD